MKRHFYLILLLIVGLSFFIGCSDQKPLPGSFARVSRDYSYQHSKQLAQFASLAYEQKEDVTKSLNKLYPNDWVVEFIDDQDTDGQAYFFANDKDIIIAFRGTKGFSDFIIDAQFWNRDTKKGGIHTGFNKQYKNLILSIQQLTAKHITAQHRIWVTGHSLGGALAAIYTAHINPTFQARIGGTYSYGQPPSGNKKFTEYLKASLPDGFFRITNISDSIVGDDDDNKDRAGVEIFYDTSEQPYCGRPELGGWEYAASTFSFGHKIEYYIKLLKEPKIIKEGTSIEDARSRCHLIVGRKKA